MDGLRIYLRENGKHRVLSQSEERAGPERIRQIKECVLNRLRHPSRIRKRREAG